MQYPDLRKPPREHKPCLTDMSDSNSPSAADKKRKQFWAKAVGIVILIAVALLKPKVEAWLDSKGLGNGAQAAESGAGDDFGSGSGDLGTLEISGSSNPTGELDLDALIASADESSTKPGQAQKSSGKSTSQIQKTTTKPSTKPGTSTKAAGKDDRSNPNKPSTSTKSKKDNRPPPPGKLTLVDRQRQKFRSTAGLMYVQGSQDGHRLKHVLKHAKDNLSKPVHGVFDGNGDRDKILAWIDIAYEKGKKGGSGTKKERQGDRTVYTVRMSDRIGFVGGQKGKRNNNRPCRCLRLVVQNGNEVVTAYPSESL